MAERDQISDEERARLVQKLGELAPLHCPRCNHEWFDVAPHYTSLSVSPQIGHTLLGGPVVPCAVTFCTRCGFVSLHALGVLGFLPTKKEEAK
jgi:hypothetical protein